MKRPIASLALALLAACAVTPSVPNTSTTALRAALPEPRLASAREVLLWPLGDYRDGAITFPKERKPLREAIAGALRAKGYEVLPMDETDAWIEAARRGAQPERGAPICELPGYALPVVARTRPGVLVAQSALRCAKTEHEWVDGKSVAHEPPDRDACELRVTLRDETPADDGEQREAESEWSASFRRPDTLEALGAKVRTAGLTRFEEAEMFVGGIGLLGALVGGDGIEDVLGTSGARDGVASARSVDAVPSTIRADVAGAVRRLSNPLVACPVNAFDVDHHMRTWSVAFAESGRVSAITMEPPDVPVTPHDACVQRVLGSELAIAAGVGDRRASFFVSIARREPTQNEDWVGSFSASLHDRDDGRTVYPLESVSREAGACLRSVRTRFPSTPIDFRATADAQGRTSTSEVKSDPPIDARAMRCVHRWFRDLRLPCSAQAKRSIGGTLRVALFERKFEGARWATGAQMQRLRELHIALPSEGSWTSAEAPWGEAIYVTDTEVWLGTERVAQIENGGLVDQAALARALAEPLRGKYGIRLFASKSAPLGVVAALAETAAAVAASKRFALHLAVASEGDADSPAARVRFITVDLPRLTTVTSLGASPATSLFAEAEGGTHARVSAPSPRCANLPPIDTHRGQKALIRCVRTFDEPVTVVASPRGRLEDVVRSLGVLANDGKPYRLAISQ